MILGQKLKNAALQLGNKSIGTIQKEIVNPITNKLYGKYHVILPNLLDPLGHSLTLYSYR